RGARLRVGGGGGLRGGGRPRRRAPGRRRPAPRGSRHRVVAGAPPRPTHPRLLVAVGLLALGLGLAAPCPAQPTLPLPPKVSAKERHRLESIVKQAFAS